MEKKDELKSRREFFKSAAKSALPILAAAVLTQTPLLAKIPSEACPCQGSCKGTCQYDSCRDSCSATCKGSCKYDSCRISCQGCKGGCKYASKY